jgi:P pilus assembly chaperone PapD
MSSSTNQTAAARSRRRRVIVAAAVAISTLTAGAVALRAVSVSPMSVFMTHTNRTATMTLYNPNPLPEEIEISFAFGYPQSDSAGDVSVPLSEVAPAGEPSAVPWLRAFPRRLVLQPGQQQVVRIMAQPPAGIADGEYWSRVLVTATGGRPPVEQQVQPDVRVAISMRTIIVASLNYRKGQLSTGIEMTAASAQRTAAGLQVTLDMARRGEAAYLGSIHLELLDAAGTVVHEEDDIMSVYRTLRRRFTLPGMQNVTQVRYTLATERPELGQANVITAPAVSGVIDVR